MSSFFKKTFLGFKTIKTRKRVVFLPYSHEALKPVPDGDFLSTGVLVCSVEGLRLPVCPVEVRADDHETIRVRHIAQDLLAVAAVEVAALDAFKFAVVPVETSSRTVNG